MVAINLDELSHTDLDSSVRSGLPDDCEQAVDLILLAAPYMLTYVFGNGDLEQTKHYIRTSWHEKYSQFGYAQHIVLQKADNVTGVCSHWHSQMPAHFTHATAKVIAHCYSKEEAEKVIRRSQEPQFVVQKPRDEELIFGNFAISPDYRRQGLATELVKRLVSVAKQKHKSLLSLDVEKSNVNAIRFYQAVGFACEPENHDSSFLHMSLSVSSLA